MPDPWIAEREAPPELARALLEGQFPELAPLRLEPFGAGWDNTAYLVNDEYVVRFPRRQVAVPLLETELRVLPAIAAGLPLPVPVPVLIGKPADAFPWPFAGYRRLAGRGADVADLDEGQRLDAAAPVGRFLARLHAMPPPEGTPADVIGRMDLARRGPRTRENLETLDLGLDLTRQLALAEEMPTASWPERRVLAHGDLYSRHLLVDESGRPSGVIDWGDVHAGSPAVDLAFAFSFLGPAAREEFRRAYGEVDEATWRAARLRALNHSTYVAKFAQGISDRDLLRESLRSLRNVVEG